MMYINKRKVCLRLILIAIISFFAFAFTACDEVALEKIHLTGVPENVTVGDVFEVEVIFEPENATDTTFSWSTPTPNLIEMEIVDTIAVITAKSVGTAMIVVTARDGNLVRTQSFEIYPNSLALTIGDANGIVEREYNNLPQGVIAGGAPGDVEIEYTYKLQGSLDIPSTTPPTNVGTYDVVARIVNSNFSGMGTGTLIIKKQDLIVTANDLSKTYGESDGGLTRIVSKGKLYEGVTISGSLKREVGEDVGEYDIIEDEPFTLAGDKKDNYNLIFQKGTFTILPKRLDITVMNKSSQYGLELVPLTYTASGFINGDDESVIKGKLSLPDDAKNAGTYNIIVGLTAENYTISTNNAKYIITKAPITVTANNKTKIYGDLTPSLDYAIKNTSNASDTTKLFYQDTLSGELAIFDDINVGQQQITRGTLNNDNYTITFVSGILDIVPREVEIEITTNLSKVYGESDLTGFDYIVADSKNTLVAGDKITGMFGRELGEEVGEYELNLGTLSAGTNYILSLKAGVFTISQREIEVSIHNESIIYGEPLSNIAYDIVGELAFNERLEFIFPNVDDYKNVGTYENVSYTSVKILNASDEEKQSNYKIKNTVGTIIITKRPIEVICKDSEQVYGDGENILLYSIINNGALAYNDEFSGEIVREQGKNVGEYVISQGTLALNDNYDLTVINGVYKIVPRAVEIEITSGISKVYGEQDPQTFDYQVVSDNNIIDGDSLSGMFGRELGEDVGEYQLNIGTLSLGDNYILTLKDGAFTITPLDLNVTIIDKTFVYGEQLLFEYSLDKILPYQDMEEVFFMDYENYRNVNIYQNVEYKSILIKNNEKDVTANYNITCTSATIEITKCALTVICDDKEQIYGDNELVLTYQLQADNVLYYNDEFSGEIVREQGKNVGEYVISQGTLELNDNYDLTVINGVYKIVPRAVEIEITSGISKIYGEQDPETFDYQVVSDNNIIEGDSLSGMFGRELGEDVGEYQLNIGTLSLGDNYILTLKDGEFTISKRIVQININNASKTVGEDDPIFTWQYATDSLEILNDDVQITLTREIGEEVGTYTISYESINGKVENYDITINSAIFTINELTGMTNNSN